MATNNEIITNLSDLGLNSYESRVYLALIEEGTSTAKNISDVTSIPYGKIYETLNSLDRKGFVVCTPTKPMKYQAVDPTDVIKLAKDKHEQNFKSIENNITKKLLPLFLENKEFQDSKTLFWVLNGRSNANKKIEELFEKAKKEIKIITTVNGLKRLVIFKEPLIAASENGVDISIIAPFTDECDEEIESLSFCNFNHSKDARSQLIVIDDIESLLIEPIPDDDNIVYGRDVGMHITSEQFTGILNNSFRVAVAETKNTAGG